MNLYAHMFAVFLLLRVICMTAIITMVYNFAVVT